MLTIYFYGDNKKQKQFTYDMDNAISRDMVEILFRFIEETGLILGRKYSLKNDDLYDYLSTCRDYHDSMLDVYGYNVNDEDYEENYYVLICNQLIELMYCCRNFNKIIIKDDGLSKVKIDFINQMADLDLVIPREKKLEIIEKFLKEGNKKKDHLVTRGKGF